MNGIDLYDGITLHQGDCRDIMRSLPADHFDAVITDPPYGISFAGEKWDTATPQGFQAWTQSWGEEALRVIKLGGYLLAFSAPRTYHRLTSGLEDAGFEIRDAMAWIRADGKPAGVDLSSAFDRAAGVLDQRDGRVIERWDTSGAATDMASYKTNATGKPVTDEAKAWEGWGVGLKPAWEPIVVARRPLVGRLVDNVREHGTGAMNIRAGMAAGTRSGLWESMAAAVETTQPRLVVWENVQGALSARAYSPVESEPTMLGDRATRPALRAAGRVAGDLAGLGYDCRWAVVRASDAGAPHQRARLFLVGHPHGQPWDMRRPAAPRKAAGRRPQCEPTGPSDGALIPTPTASDHKAGRHPEGTGHSLTQAVQLLPTPVAQPSGNSPSEHLRKKPGRERVTDLAIIVENDLLPTGGLLPTPQAVNAPRSSTGYGPNLHEVATSSDLTHFGPYAKVIARWEQITGRAAPPPSTPSRRPGGKPQLSTRFVEWLMGLPDGHVTDLDLPREHQLRLLGNGVVPQQAALAVGTLIRAARTEERS